MASVVAGIALALMAIFGAWAHLGALAPLFVEGDAARTTENISATEPLFRVGAAAMIFMAVLDIIVAVPLYTGRSTVAANTPGTRSCWPARSAPSSWQCSKRITSGSPTPSTWRSSSPQWSPPP
jgi:hypothetical protein